MSRRHFIAPTLAGLIVSVLTAASPAGARVSCIDYAQRRVDRFADLAEHAIVHCLRRAERRGTSCPDDRLDERLATLRDRVGNTIERRCPGSDAERRLRLAETSLLCERLGRCAALGSITVHVARGGATAPDAVTSGGSVRTRGAATENRSLVANAGWTGLAHGLEILEGASFTADLSNCDGVTDTVCDLHGATAGSAFGAPSPIGAGGVPVCVGMGFDSDLTGSIDVASGDLTESARMRIQVFMGTSQEEPCPACVTADGDPELGESGTCSDGLRAGLPCTVEGLADPGYASKRGTSTECQPDVEPIGEFVSVATATSGPFVLATSAASPDCTYFPFQNWKCHCDTCDDAAATPCMSNADCSGGICGGPRCLDFGDLHGTPCASAGSDPMCGVGTCGGDGICTSGPRTGGFCLADEDCHGWCGTPGQSTAPNPCNNGVCTPTADGGVCANGPSDGRCAVQTFRGCLTDADCPFPGDTCEAHPRSCFPDSVELVGTPDPPVDNLAHPTLVGGFCMGTSGSSAANLAGGFPGPVSYVWPTEVVFGD